MLNDLEQLDAQLWETPLRPFVKLILNVGKLINDSTFWILQCTHFLIRRNKSKMASNIELS